MLNQPLSDGVISKDEHALLKNVKKNYGIYEEHLKLALEDGIITNEENADLTGIRKKMYQEALEIAHQDGIITDSESKILKILKASIGIPDCILTLIEEQYLDDAENKERKILGRYNYLFK